MSSAMNQNQRRSSLSPELRTRRRSPPGFDRLEYSMKRGTLSMSTVESDESPSSEYWQSRESCRSRESFLQRVSLASPMQFKHGSVAQNGNSGSNLFQGRSQGGAQGDAEFRARARTLSLGKHQRPDVPQRSYTLDQERFEGEDRFDEYAEVSNHDLYSHAYDNEIRSRRTVGMADMNERKERKQSLERARAEHARSMSVQEHPRSYFQEELRRQSPYSSSSAILGARSPNALSGNFSPNMSQSSPGTASSVPSYSGFQMPKLPMNMGQGGQMQMPFMGGMDPNAMQMQMDQLQMMMDQMKMMQTMMHGQFAQQPAPQQAPASVRSSAASQQSAPQHAVSRPSNVKFCACFVVPDIIVEARRFRCTSHIIGNKGANMKNIATKTDAKLRVRGKYSGHREGPEMLESPDPLQLCISAPTQESLDTAIVMVEELWKDMYKAFGVFQKALGQEVTELPWRVIDGDVARVGETL